MRKFGYYVDTDGHLQTAVAPDAQAAREEIQAKVDAVAEEVAGGGAMAGGEAVGETTVHGVRELR